MDFDSMNDAFNLIDGYESRYGGLFVNSRSDKYGFKQEDSDDGYTLERIILTVQQAILDEVYQGTLNKKAYQTRIHDSIVENCKDYLRGRYWKTSTYFPGFVDLPAQQSNAVHSVDIDATVNQYWGKTECFSSSPTIHATGLYVPPGGVAWINVPSVLVDKGFQIQVGANDVDTIIKDNQRRMDRITCTYEVTTSKTYVSSPLGGGIYIKVPYLSNFGVQSVSISGDAIEAPFMSMTSLKTTTEAEWNVMKDSTAPWADFESYYYMQNVPTSWISEFDFDHVKTLLEGRSALMKAINYIGGFPNDKRNQQVLYLQPDVHIKHHTYGVGYPQVNSLVSTGKYDSIIKPDPNHYLVSDPFLLEYKEFHERGHCMYKSESYYRGEKEAIVNFPYAYAMSVAAGQTLEYAFSYSISGKTGMLTPDMASVDWMITVNFREGNEMETDNEFKHQPRGHAKYADLCILFGCEVLHKFFYQEHLDHMAGDPNFFKPKDYDFNDFRTLRLSIQAGVDLTPLMHYWGIHPADKAKLQASMNANNLKVSIDIFNLITYRLDLIPKNRDEFLAFFRSGWPGKENPESGECQWQWAGCGQYLYWLDKWDETISNQARAAGQAILDLYYNTVPTPTSAPITPTPTPPTPTPTPPTPSNSCTDSTLRFRVKNKSTGKFITRDCEWVQAKPFRCSWNGVISHCQSTCTNGCPSCQDATLKFKVMLGGRKRSKKCTWVAKRATASRCKNEGVRETCRKTCKEC